MTVHSELSPSAAHRWLNCTGSLLYKGKPPGKAALEGIEKHDEAAAHLEANTDSDCEHVQLYLDTVRSIRGQPIIEHTVILQSVASDVFGTADAIVVDPFVRLTIVDFKFGSGVEVDAFHNPQLSIYAMATIDSSISTSVDDIDLIIVQPRAPSDSKIKIWRTTLSELEPVRDRVREVYRIHKAKKHTHVPGEWCQWCPGANQCPAIIKALSDALTPLDTIQIDKLSRILETEKGILEAYKQLKSEAKKLLSQGIAVPGFKLVQSFGHRAWKDEEKVHKKVGKRKATKPVTLSPAQFEKQYPELKSWVQQNTERPDRGLRIAPKSDKREAATLTNALPELE